MNADWASRMRRVNGVTLHVIEAGPDEGPLLILLHGFPEFWWGWWCQITHFAGQGYRVVVPDMRGYNLSDAPPGIGAYHLDRLVGDVIALANVYGADRFDLVGHDWGGIVAWATAMQNPERLRRLVVMSAPHPDLFVRQTLLHPTQVMRSSYVALFQLPWLPEAILRAGGFAALRRVMRRSSRPGTFDEEAIRPYLEAWKRPGRLTSMLNYYRAIRGRSVRDRAEIIPPTLILWGERDGFLGLHLARSALQLCRDGRLRIVEGGTHWLHHEEAARVNAEIAAHVGFEPQRRTLHR